MTTIVRTHVSEVPADVFHGYAYMTASVFDLSDSDDSGADGWIDPRWSMTTLHDSRNDVRPAATWNRRDDIDDGESVSDSLARWISETVEEYLGEAENEQDGTYYGAGETTTPDGEVWKYALHFVVSHHAMRRPDAEYRVFTD